MKTYTIFKVYDQYFERNNPKNERSQNMNKIEIHLIFFYFTIVFFGSIVYFVTLNGFHFYHNAIKIKLSDMNAVPINVNFWDLFARNAKLVP